MARPSIWFYPVDGGPVEELTLGSSLQELAPLPYYDRASPRRGDGTPHHLLIGGGLRVLVRRERLAAGTAQRGLLAVEDHLLRGGVIGIAADRSKAFAGYVETGLVGGGSTIEGPANIYADLLSEALSLAAGDRIVLESGAPECRREELVIDTVSVTVLGFSITTTTPIRFDRSAEMGVMVRHADFYPALYLPEEQLGRPLVTTEHGALWTFEATLEVVQSLYSAEVQAFGAGVLGEASPRTTEATFDMLSGGSPSGRIPTGMSTGGWDRVPSSWSPYWSGRGRL